MTKNDPKELKFTLNFILQELVAASPNQRNWKGISIAIFVIVAILASVAISVYIMTPEEEEPRVPGSRFGIEHILDERFSPPGFNGSWISGNTIENFSSTFTVM